MTLHLPTPYHQLLVSPSTVIVLAKVTNGSLVDHPRGTLFILLLLACLALSHAVTTSSFGLQETTLFLLCLFLLLCCLFRGLLVVL